MIWLQEMYICGVGRLNSLKYILRYMHQYFQYFFFEKPGKILVC